MVVMAIRSEKVWEAHEVWRADVSFTGTLKSPEVVAVLWEEEECD